MGNAREEEERLLTPSLPSCCTRLFPNISTACGGWGGDKAVSFQARWFVSLGEGGKALFPSDRHKTFTFLWSLKVRPWSPNEVVMPWGGGAYAARGAQMPPCPPRPPAVCSPLLTVASGRPHRDYSNLPAGPATSNNHNTSLNRNFQPLLLCLPGERCQEGKLRMEF